MRPGKTRIGRLLFRSGNDFRFVVVRNDRSFGRSADYPVKKCNENGDTGDYFNKLQGSRLRELNGGATDLLAENEHGHDQHKPAEAFAELVGVDLADHSASDQGPDDRSGG